MTLPGHGAECPFQRLETCNGMLLVARMGSIHTYAYDKADDKFKYLWTWKAHSPNGEPPSPLGSALPADVRNEEALSQLAGLEVLDEVLQPPAKRRRVEEMTESLETHELSSQNSAKEKDKADDKAGDPQPDVKSDKARYSRVVSCMKATGDHIVATTYHDKAIWVLKLHSSGRLEVLSQRYVIINPSTVALASTINPFLESCRSAQLPLIYLERTQLSARTSLGTFTPYHCFRQERIRLRTNLQH